MRLCDVVLTEDQLTAADAVLDDDPAVERAWVAVNHAYGEARSAEQAHKAAEVQNDASGSVENEQRWLETWDRYARAEYKSALAEIALWRRILKARADYARKLVEGAK